ncbi:MAG: PEP-CTERM sorting domain-containing protein, partial [Planctomycetota bacterium]|nr:PEP-CTERM sorting domain-containing protein [Planctomycetota bacterium]
PSLAYATSGASMKVFGGNNLASGRLWWTPGLSGSVSGSAVAFGRPIIRDPVSVSVHDFNTGLDLLNDELIRIDIDGFRLTDSESVGWDETTNVLVATAANYAVSIDITSPYISAPERGSVEFRVENGFVVQSEDGGIFDGLFPAVGASGDVFIQMPELAFDYNLDALGELGNRDLDVRFEFSSSGSTVPEPASIVSLLIGMIVVGAVESRRRWNRFAKLRAKVSME